MEDINEMIKETNLIYLKIKRIILITQANTA
jgi:hypothetical protein